MATLADLRERFPFLRDIPVVNDEGDPLKGELFPIPFMVFASQAGGSLKNGEVEAYMLPGLQGDFNIFEAKCQTSNLVCRNVWLHKQRYFDRNVSLVWLLLTSCG